MEEGERPSVAARRRGRTDRSVPGSEEKRLSIDACDAVADGGWRLSEDPWEEDRLGREVDVSARSAMLKAVTVLLIAAAIVVGLAGGIATVCNGFEPGCYDQGADTRTAVQLGLLAAGSVGLLVAAAVVAFRRGRSR